MCFYVVRDAEPDNVQRCVVIGVVSLGWTAANLTGQAFQLSVTDRISNCDLSRTPFRMLRRVLRRCVLVRAPVCGGFLVLGSRSGAVRRIRSPFLVCADLIGLVREPLARRSFCTTLAARIARVELFQRLLLTAKFAIFHNAYKAD